MAHLSQKQLRQRIDNVALRIGDTYFHYKDLKRKMPYEIAFVGLWEASDEICVGYRALYGEKILWVRTVENFLEEKEIEGKKVKRFTKAS